MVEIVSETIARIYYEDILFRGIEDCRKARVFGDLTRYSEAVMALFDTLSPELRNEVEPTYQKIKVDVEAEVKQVREQSQKLTNPLEQAGYYQARIATIERESADKLYREMIKVLDVHGMLVKRREAELIKKKRLE